jgi:hypothetical protein
VKEVKRSESGDIPLLGHGLSLDFLLYEMTHFLTGKGTFSYDFLILAAENILLILA